MTPAARIQATIELLDKIHHANSPADAILNDYFRSRRYIGSSDRREISATAYEILRNTLKLTATFEALGCSVPLTSRILYLIFAVSNNEISPLELTRLFSGQAHAPQELSQQEIKCLQAVGKFDSNTLAEEALYNVPSFLYTPLKEFFGTSFYEEINALNTFAPLDIRVNTLKSSKDQVKSLLNAQNIPFIETDLSPYGFRLSSRRPLGTDPMWHKGYIEVQDEGSQLIALLCNAKPGLRVMDYCAGAGGKSLAMSMVMENKGNIVACDIYNWRLKRAQQRARKAGCHNIEYRPLEENDKWLKRQKERFDRVLIDVPCSGTGTWRRNPDLKRRFKEQDLEEVILKQKNILEKACEYVKPGGLLIYSTCSLLPRENRQQIDAFLQTHPEFTEKSVKGIWEQVLEAPYPGTSEPSLQLTPFRSGTDGFFISILEKR